MNKIHRTIDWVHYECRGICQRLCRVIRFFAMESVPGFSCRPIVFPGRYSRIAGVFLSQ